MFYKHRLRYYLAASYKALGTLCAACMALTAALRLDPACWICFAALILHAAADYTLEFNMYIGGGLFLAGHICYIAFFTHLFPVSGTHLIVLLCLLAITAFLFLRWRGQMGKQLPLFLVYAVILCVTAACAIAGFGAHSLQGQLIAVGGALFFLSDAFLLARILFSATQSVDWFIMITYYIAQLLFGLSCLV
jgi:YhhN-like protein.